MNSNKSQIKPHQIITLALGLSILYGCAPAISKFEPAGDMVEYRDYCRFKESNKFKGDCVDSFYIDIHEVTQSEFEFATGINPSFHKGFNKCPVETVSYSMAKQYCEHLGKRLPTWGQWLYALYTSEPEIFQKDKSALDDFLNRTSWLVKNSSTTTHEVMSLSPTKSGMYDMIGNVWEIIDEVIDTSDLPKEFRNNKNFDHATFYYPVAGYGWDSFRATVIPLRSRNVSDWNKSAETGFRCVLIK